ncbi:exopolysaccharide biosynthesis polyprenyl glycosylphosphotransferase [Pontibacter sp. E15-1]|uniref:exopolysaccharide biosynthesis polyprenyl glycosylphosphotransferase n=1 Tax=Pontibacter sp. E15-1 TaxID=2919918 RepID=UPI001F500D50|nr:exopolysaccharide biosynthesis polyprenyl glycosylphosphotransferase [Pontibacter sp. E15-1]MCJ8164114.1 exopolysaccharide biosynthesis polyprenyl glycosylphosphotransferase [Pontibacter sp. E15-1]
MINVPQKLPAIVSRRYITLLALIILVSLYIIEYKVIDNTDWVLTADFLLVMYLLRFWKDRNSDRWYKSISHKAINLVITYLILVCLAFLLYFVSPASLPDFNLNVAFVFGLPLLGIPVNLVAVQVARQFNGKKSTLIAGVGNQAANVEHELRNRHIKGYIRCKREECLVRQDQVVGDLSDIHKYLQENAVDEIVIALPAKPSKKIRDILIAADYFGVRVKYVPDYINLFGKYSKTKRFGHLEAVNVRQLPLDGSLASFLKNSFDFTFSLLALVLLLPVFIGIAISIKLDSPGPVFYCPIRIGKANKAFRVFKFRSMYKNDGAKDGILSTQMNDPRVTRIGSLLRKYSLDELPQFINVLLGNMSVVGPRPHRSYLNQQMQASEDKYMIRHYFKPGITGWAQVNGWRGPTETKEQKSQRTKHDIWYMENWSLGLDVKIIWLTIFGSKTHRSAF